MHAGIGSGAKDSRSLQIDSLNAGFYVLGVPIVIIFSGRVTANGHITESQGKNQLPVRGSAVGVEFLLAEDVVGAIPPWVGCPGIVSHRSNRKSVGLVILILAACIMFKTRHVQRVVDIAGVPVFANTSVVVGCDGSQNGQVLVAVIALFGFQSQGHVQFRTGQAEIGRWCNRVEISGTVDIHGRIFVVPVVGDFVLGRLDSQVLDIIDAAAGDGRSCSYRTVTMRQVEAAHVRHHETIRTRRARRLVGEGRVGGFR